MSEKEFPKEVTESMAFMGMEKEKLRKACGEVGEFMASGHAKDRASVMVFIDALPLNSIEKVCVGMYAQSRIDEAEAMVGVMKAVIGSIQEEI